MAYGEQFVAIANDPWGEPCVPRLWLRTKAGDLVDVAALEQILAVSDIDRKRERKFGVVQGTPWQVKLTNATAAMANLDLPGCRAVLQAGFRQADVWELMAQGRIERAPASTDMTVTIEVEDAVMDALSYVLPRDMYFGTVGWAGDLTPVLVSEASAEFDNDVNQTVGGNGVAVIPAGSSQVRDETFRVVFTSATGYKVVYEDGTERTGFTISADATFGPANAPTASVFKIKAAGWSTEVGAYVVSDEFQFFSSHARTTLQLSTMGMVRHLLTDVAGLSAHDVLSGAPYSSPLYDADGAWADAVAAASGTRIGGYWAKGTRLIEMVQEALMIAHASIFSAPTGQIAVSWLREAGPTVATVNGDPEAGVVDIVSGTSEDTLEDMYNEVTLTYLSLRGGQTAVARWSDDASPIPERRVLELETSWRVSSVTASDCVYKALSRAKVSRRNIKLQTTLAHACRGIDEIVSITDPIIGLRNHLCGVVSVSIDIMGQRATLEAYRDEVASANYARVGHVKIGDTAFIW